jgi:hypothetical protein
MYALDTNAYHSSVGTVLVGRTAVKSQRPYAKAAYSVIQLRSLLSLTDRNAELIKTENVLNNKLYTLSVEWIKTYVLS